MNRFRAHVSGSRTSATRRMAGIIRNYRDLIDHVEQGTPAVLLEAMEPTFEKSKDYCPKDTGDLVNSGYMKVSKYRGPRVEIGYGKGGDPEYAVAVHENLEWRHKAPTRAKWLQVALEEDSDRLQSRIIGAYARMF